MSGCIVVMKLPITSYHTLGLLNHLHSFHGSTFKLNAKCDADSLLYLLSHFECNSHTVHMLTQRHLPLPRMSTMKLLLFTYAHSSPPIHSPWLPGYHSHYINNGWTFSGQTKSLSLSLSITASLPFKI